MGIILIKSNPIPARENPASFKNIKTDKPVARLIKKRGSELKSIILEVKKLQWTMQKYKES